MGLAAGRRSLPGRRGAGRAHSASTSPGVPCRSTQWKRRIHPDDLGAFNAAADSCQHGGDRFECEYRLLAAGHRWLWVLHRGRVVQRERDGARCAHHRPAARHRPAQERGSRAQRQRVASRHGAVGRARRVLAMARAQQRAHREPAVAGDDRLLARAVGSDAESVVQQPASRGPRTRRPAAAASTRRAMRDSVEFEYRFQTASGEYRWMQDRGRAVEWDLQGRPVLVIGVTLDIDAAKRAEAHLRLERTHARDRGLGRGHRPVGNQFRHRHHALVQRLVRPPRHRSLRRHRSRAALGREPASRTKGPKPRAVSTNTSTARPSTTTPSTASGRAAAPGAGCSSAAAWSSATRNGKAVRMLGVCMDLDETKVAERRANARNERVEAALQLTTAGVWDWDVEHGITNHTDGYYRVFGVDPAFGRANSHELAAAARHRSRGRHRQFPRPPAARRSRRSRCSRPNTASATPTAAGTGRSTAPTSWIATPDGATRRVARPRGGHHRAQDPRNWRCRPPTSASARSPANCAA